MHLSEAQTAALLDAAPDSIVVTDSTGNIVLVNSRTEALFGYARHDLLGRPIETLLPVRFRAGHAAHRSSYALAPRVRPMGTGLELFALRKDGTEFPVEISLSPLQSESGLLISSAIRDITARKAAEKALIEAQQEADRANRAKSAFLAAASHDLRQPLQTLSLVNTVLTRTSPPGSKAAEVAEIQAEAIRSMSELLSSLLDISKLEAGAVKPDIRDCSVRAVFERVRAQFAAQAEAKGLRLLLDECDDLVRTDPTLLQQIVQNLVANAIRYTHEGHVHLRCPATGATVRIEVLDTGSGIPREEQERIFEDFYQVSRDSGGRTEGLGLGLSIVRRTADLLGHAVEVESEPGKGSRFTVAVPKGERPPTTKEQSPEMPRAIEESERFVLIVDDETAVAQATAMLLEVTGHRATVAASFDEARSRLKEASRAPDVIICDVHLAGGETGPETIRKLRALSSRVIPAVLITGDTSTDATAMLEGLDQCHLLSKPVDGDALLDLVDRLR